jgi:Flp pilus assembly protein TadG
MRPSVNPKREGERGSAAVEFALVLPLILVMILVVVEVGLLVKDQILLEESARAGAREAAVTTDDQQVSQAVFDAAVSLDQTRIDVTVAREDGVGSPVTVTVTYQAPVDIPLVAWLLPASIDLSGKAVMRQETA